MSSFQYLLQVNICLLLFYLFYLLLLRNETFFKLNRIYLLATGILAFVIPFLKADQVNNMEISQRVKYTSQTIGSVLYSKTVSPILVASEQNSWNVVDWAILIYCCGVAVALILFFRKLHLVYKPGTQSEKQQAYSFFRKVFVPADTPNRDLIYKHEQIHAKQLHTLDIFLCEAIAIINWFNPVVYGYKKSVKYIHEFIADEAAAISMDNKHEYSVVLVSNAFGTPPNNLVNSFFNKSLLKQRIMMLNKNRSTRAAILKYGLCVPLFMVLLVFSSAVTSKSHIQQSITHIEKASANIFAEPGQAASKATKKKKAVNADAEQVKPTKKLLPDIVLAKVENKNDDDVIRTIELPEVRSTEQRVTVIKKIELTQKNTIVTFEHVGTPGHWITVNKSMHLESGDGGTFYKMLKVENMPVFPEKFTFTEPGQVLTFKMYFEKIPSEETRINIIERPRSDEDIQKGITFFNYYGVNISK